MLQVLYWGYYLFLLTLFTEEGLVHQAFFQEQGHIYGILLHHSTHNLIPTGQDTSTMDIHHWETL